jgi:hypothetical protein
VATAAEINGSPHGPLHGNFQLRRGTTALAPPPPLHHPPTHTPPPSSHTPAVSPSSVRRKEVQVGPSRSSRPSRLEDPKPCIFLFTKISANSANHQCQAHHFCPITWPVSGRGHKLFSMALPVPKIFAPVFLGDLQLAINCALAVRHRKKGGVVLQIKKINGAGWL